MVESMGHDSYAVRMDGLGQLSERNRRLLRRIRTFKSVLEGSQGSQRSTQPMGPEAQGEARDVARCSKDVEVPRSSSTSPPVTGVEG